MGQCRMFLERHLTRKLFLTLFFGQILSLLLCAVGTVTQKLVVSYNVEAPAFQVFCLYSLLTIIVSTKFISKGKDSIDVFKERWWKYLLLACVNVGGGYMIFRSYQYTSLTSVQLLDCLSIPVVVILSIVFLKAKYKPIHYLGILICLGGIGFLVWADINGSRDQGPKHGDYKMLGDFLVIAAATMYGICNVAEEFVVKTSSITEFVGMLGFFGCFLSGANVIIFERHILINITWSYQVVLLLLVGTLALFSFYILMPLLMQRTSATLINLTLLTSDIYALLIGLYLFNYTFSHLYIVSFVIIVIGVLIFKLFPSPSRFDVPQSIVVEDDEEEILQESYE